MKELIILTIIGIVISLGHAMFSMVSGPTDSKASMVKAPDAFGWRCRWRCLPSSMIGWYMGRLQPN